MNLSSYLTRLNTKEGKVFDPVRKKWLTLLPEEMVRQTLILYLTEEVNCSIRRMAVEKSIRIHDQLKRFDLVYHDSAMKPLLLVECKSPSTPLIQDVLEQAVWYNYEIRAPYLLLSNGHEALWYRVDPIAKSYERLSEPPKL